MNILMPVCEGHRLKDVYHYECINTGKARVITRIFDFNSHVFGTGNRNFGSPGVGIKGA
jgi:hypothetical protein